MWPRADGGAIVERNEVRLDPTNLDNAALLLVARSDSAGIGAFRRSRLATTGLRLRGLARAMCGPKLHDPIILELHRMALVKIGAAGLQNSGAME
jgi:hypothetical protein